MSGPSFTFGNQMTASVTPRAATPAPQAAPAPVAAAAGDLIKDTTTRDFMKDVMEASRSVPVLVDFWAEWCGPCKQLTPVLEKVVKNAKGRVKLVKMNIDHYPEIAGQLGVKSIPAVFAFKNGQPVDGFMGALPESQLNAFIERIAGPIGPSDAEALIAEGEQALAEGDLQGAADLFAGAREMEPDNLKALGGLVRTLVAARDFEGAHGLLAAVPQAKQTDSAIAAARAVLDLAEQAARLGDPTEFEARVTTDPNDHEARFQLALILNAHGHREAAIDHLVDIVRRKRDWNEEQARKQLVTFFEAWGPKDEMTLLGRRRLSSVLFR